MTDLKKAFKEGWLEEDPRIVAAALLGIFTFIFLNVLLYKSEKRKKRIIQQARENDTAIEGRLIKHGSSYRDLDRGRERYYYGTYEYTVNGAVKKYRIHSKNHLPNTIKLYPKNDSMTKFFSDYDNVTGAAVSLNGVAAIAVCILTLWITEYIN